MKNPLKRMTELVLVQIPVTEHSVMEFLFNTQFTQFLSVKCRGKKKR